tara:strand:+ start:16109 stop:16531 length:423 start_codon:yes stop_codon:yes gene_type:complete
MAKSKRSSKRASKKNKKKACRKSGHSATFCDLAEAGRVLTTISAVLNFVICIVILILGIAAVKGSNKEEDADKKSGLKAVGEGGIIFSLIWAAWVGLVWWLVETYDIISVISISFWLLSLVIGIIGGVELNKWKKNHDNK